RASLAHILGMTTSSPLSSGDIVLYRVLGSVEEVCDYDHKHQVSYVDTVTVFATGETREHDNGYQKQQTRLAEDRLFGRTYHQHVSIDFYDNISWVRDVDGARFSPRLPSGPVRDTSGLSLAKCPDGPTW